MVVGVAVALAGCQGLSAQLAAAPTGGSDPGGGSSGVQAAGPVSAGSGALRVLAEPQAGLSPIYALINGARSSIELTMYDAARHHRRGRPGRGRQARGRRAGDPGPAPGEEVANTASYSYLSTHRVHVTWAPSGTTYHQKTLTVDNKTSAIMTLNMVSADYAGTRDFAVIDTSKADVTAVVATFNADFAHKKITPPDGADLVWSPTNSQAAILAVINSAKHTLAIENEEMGDPVITSALEAAAKRGVDVKITMTAQSDWDSAFSALIKTGAHVRTYKDSTKVLYIHAKAVVADAGSSDEQMYVGSENFSAASLRRNRELGIRTTNKPVISAVAAVLAADYSGATPY